MREVDLNWLGDLTFWASAIPLGPYHSILNPLCRL
jgi:hypothetical protein